MTDCVKAERRTMPVNWAADTQHITAVTGTVRASSRGGQKRCHAGGDAAFPRFHFRQDPDTPIFEGAATAAVKAVGQ